MIAQPDRPIVLEPERKCPEVLDFETKLRGRVVGQAEAVSQLEVVYQSVLAGMAIPGRPLANLLFLGPTGSGKTHLVEAAAEILFGRPNAFVKIDCAEFQHSHEIAKILGSPPGYIGHHETQPVITQEVIDSFHTDKLKMAFVLFDEIEKASDALWQLLLGILDKGSLTLGDNRKVDLSRTVIFMTSNLGTSEMTRAAAGGIGFAPPAADAGDRADEKIYRIAVEAAKRRFSPEFMNRIGKVIVFKSLSRPQLTEVLSLELGFVQERIKTTAPENGFVVNYTQSARDFLLSEGTDLRYGARHLKRAIESHVVFALSGLMASSQIAPGDLITIEHERDKSGLTFTKLQRAAPDEPGSSNVTSCARQVSGAGNAPYFCASASSFRR